jgi:ketosteroid isomerase-like protein
LEAIVSSTQQHLAMVHPASEAGQASIVRRLDEIWAAAARRDFEALESYHAYGPAFTSFKDGAPREDGRANAAGERATFGLLENPGVDMRDLLVAMYGTVGIATFNGHFTASIHGQPTALDQQATMVFALIDGDWKIVHEHLSPLTGVPTVNGDRVG